MIARADLETSADVRRLVDAFYTRVREDPMLGPIFNDVAHVDWASHLLTMYAFWESVLFAKAGFKGNPMAVHRALAMRTPLRREAFERWLHLFGASLDEHFEGPMTEAARARAARIADVLQFHIEQDDALAAGRRG